MGAALLSEVIIYCCLDLSGCDLVCHPACQEVLRTLVPSGGPSHGQESYHSPMGGV